MFKYLACISGPFLIYSTSSNEGYKQLPSSLINKEVTGSMTTYQLKFEFKGQDGATLKLHQKADLNDNEGYIISVGGNILPKSSISKLNTATKYVRTIPNLYNKDEYKAFWIQWTSGNNKGVNIAVGQGTEIGRNKFMNLPDQAGVEVSYVSIASVMAVQTSTALKGSWKFDRGENVLLKRLLRVTI